MIPSVDPSAQLFLADLSGVQSQIDRATRQISSGLKIQQPSDAPDQLGTLLQIRSDLDRNTQVTANLAEVKSETDSAESSLETAAQLLDRATTLASEGASTTQTAANRLAAVQEVQGILQELVGLSNTAVQGRFVFSGDQAPSPSYSINLANPNGVNRLVTPTATRQIEDASGVTFTVALTAQDVFDHRNPDDSLASDNVFAAVNGLLTSLQNNDQPGVISALNSLHSAAGYLATQLSFYGSVQNRIQGAQTFASAQQVQLQTQLSQTQDADITQAAIDLTQSNTHLNAALSAEAKQPRTSLFDFLG
jgi:flagellar hook-associated protein 3 FlgL